MVITKLVFTKSKIFEITCDGTPEFEDEVVGEAEGLEVRVVDGLGQLHRIGLALSQLPDLGG